MCLNTHLKISFSREKQVGNELIIVTILNKVKIQIV